jgi:GntR family transcriptional repressor for pyruvate dehydrogenase complex
VTTPQGAADLPEESTGTSGAPAFRSITPVRAYEGVVAQVEEAIFSGTLQPGQRLASERDLMAQFGVSRNTVREALRVLESNGLVRSRPGDPSGGAEVQANSTGRLAKALTSFARLGQIGIAELVEFRMVVEGSAVRLAAELHTQSELEAMQGAYSQMQRAADESYEAFSAADVSFHLSVAACAGNQFLSACSEFARDLVLKLTTDKLRQSVDRPALIQETLRRHGAYLEAIAERDGNHAERLAREDLYDYYSVFVTEAERLRLRLLSSGSSHPG